MLAAAARETDFVLGGEVVFEKKDEVQ